MRPPEFTGGNRGQRTGLAADLRPRFNEAAGIHRRKLFRRGCHRRPPARRFNEAAGIHRRKHGRMAEKTVLHRLLLQ